MARVGVFICHCGENIARTVDVAAGGRGGRQVARRGVQRGLQVHVLRPGPAVDPQGHRGPQADRRGGRRVQPADARDRPSAAPPPTAGLNPYLLKWPTSASTARGFTSDRAAATAKAIDLVRVMVEKVKRNRGLYPSPSRSSRRRWSSAAASRASRRRWTSPTAARRSSSSRRAPPSAGTWPA